MSNKLTNLPDGSLALPGGHISKQLVLSRLINNNSRNGYIVSKTSDFKDYTLERIHQENQEMFIVGPAYPDAESAEKLTPENAVQIIDAIKELQKREIQIHSIDLRYILLKQDETLFLPFNLVRSLSLTQNIQEEIVEYHPYHNSDINGDNSVAFTLACHLYEYFTADLAFSGSTREELNEKMRSGHFIPVEYQKPGINIKLANLLNNILDATKKAPTDVLEKLRNVLQEDVLVEEIDETRRNNAAVQKQQLSLKLERKARVKYLTRQYGTAAIILASVFVIVGFLVIPVILKQLEPPMTIGFSREQVIYSYYNSFNDLDFELLKDTYINEAGERRFNIVSNQYVVNRVRTGYGLEAFLSAAEWDKMGRPSEIHGQVVFGITNLEIDAVDSESYLAQYEEYFPEAIEEDNPAGGSISRGRFITEKLSLERKDDVWYISSIEPISEEQLDTTIILLEN